MAGEIVVVPSVRPVLIVVAEISTRFALLIVKASSRAVPPIVSASRTTPAVPATRVRSRSAEESAFTVSRMISAPSGLLPPSVASSVVAAPISSSAEPPKSIVDEPAVSMLPFSVVAPPVTRSVPRATVVPTFCNVIVPVPEFKVSDCAPTAVALMSTPALNSSVPALLPVLMSTSPLSVTSPVLKSTSLSVVW